MNKQNKKAQTKGFIKGILFSFLIIATILSISAAQMTRTATLNYNNIKICIDGEYITPKDAAGNVVEPFIIDGTTYLPVRAVATAFGKNVEWEGSTSTVFLGEKPSNEDGKGTRSAPYSPSLGKTIEHNRFSSEAVDQIQITCNYVIRGEAGKLLMAKTNQFNTVPNNSQEWLVFDLNLKYISSSKGEDNLLNAMDVIYTEYFFSPSGKLNVVTTGAFSDILPGYTAHKVSIYPGASSRVLYAILVNKFDGDILLQVPYNRGDNNTWIKMNSDTNVITTKAELNEYLRTAS